MIVRYYFKREFLYFKRFLHKAKDPGTFGGSSNQHMTQIIIFDKVLEIVYGVVPEGKNSKNFSVAD